MKNANMKNAIHGKSLRLVETKSAHSWAAYVLLPWSPCITLAWSLYNNRVLPSLFDPKQQVLGTWSDLFLAVLS